MCIHFRPKKYSSTLFIVCNFDLPRKVSSQIADFGYDQLNFIIYQYPSQCKFKMILVQGEVVVFKYFLCWCYRISQSRGWGMGGRHPILQFFSKLHPLPPKLLPPMGHPPLKNEAPHWNMKLPSMKWFLEKAW